MGVGLGILGRLGVLGFGGFGLWRDLGSKAGG